MKASFHTFGCKLNFAETSTIARELARRGVERAAEGEVPDLCVVNTCSVTETADKKCRQLIHRLARQYPGAAIAVTGCYAQLKAKEIATFPNVAVVAGSAEKLCLVQFIEQWMRSGNQQVAAADVTRLRTFDPSCERGDRTRYFLKVQDGCDCFCSYCTIPYARGRSRSGTIGEMVEQAQRAAREGGKEIILTGVNIGDFGKGRDDNFFDLIRALDEVEGIDRYRISSIEPDLLSHEIIEWVARQSRAFMPHFHIPLQCGSDAVLRLMGRRYDTALFADRIRIINELLPDAFIGVDVIAGARGETPERWQESYSFIESLGITRLHVFPYSERPGTRALGLPDAVPVAERHRRVHDLTALSDARLQAFSEGQLGRVRPVLWERYRGNTLNGLTDNYLRVEAPVPGGMDPESLTNTITNVRLTAVDGETMTGEHVG